MPWVGEELRRERELRGIRLEEIADETKIGVRFLEAIDTGRMEIIPGEFYRRASLRAYAGYLGIDADRVLATYEFRSARKSGPRVPPEAEPGGARHLRATRAVKWIALAMGGLGLSVAAVAVWPGGGAKGTPAPLPTSAAGERGGRTVAEAVVRDEPPAGPVVRDEIERDQALALPLRLIIKVNEPCWLEVHVDGEIASQGLMLRGFEKEFQAEGEIRLWLGNAGGVSIWVNDRPGISLGRAGQVRKDVLISTDNLMEFVASDEETEVVPVSKEGPAD